MWSDHVSPQQARVIPNTSSHPPVPPVRRKPFRNSRAPEPKPVSACHAIMARTVAADAEQHLKSMVGDRHRFAGLLDLCQQRVGLRFCVRASGT
jgi:hypothetical protein